MAFPKLPGSLRAAGEKAHDAAMYPATKPEKHQALKQSLHTEAEKHVAALVKSGADLGKAAEHHRAESARAFGGGDLAHGIVAAKLQKVLGNKPKMRAPTSSLSPEAARVRQMADTGKHVPLQTGVKGGTFYVTSTGEKVYVGKGKG